MVPAEPERDAGTGRAGLRAPFYERLWEGDGGAENRARWSFQAGLVERALARLGPPGELGGRRLLEIGPGAGRESARLLEQGARVVAVDLARTALLRTREATGGAALLVQAEAERLPLAAASVDLVFAQTVLMHLERARAAAEWARVLRPGGRVVILEPLAFNPLVGAYRRFLSPYRETRPRYLRLGELRRLSPDLEVVHHQEHVLLEVLALALPGAAGRLLRTPLGILDRVLLRVPGLGGLAWMVIAELRRR